MDKTIAVRSDWETTEMPVRKASFKIKRHFTEEEIRTLKCGHVPQEQEDKWFWYVENDTLYAHRSWTGICIYIVRFDFSTDVHHVTVNRDKKQYDCTSEKEDMLRLNSLLDQWGQPGYDPYAQWLDETAAAFKRNDD